MDRSNDSNEASYREWQLITSIAKLNSESFLLVFYSCKYKRESRSKKGIFPQIPHWILKFVLILMSNYIYSWLYYRKVARSSLSRLVAQFQIFRRLMKGKFDAYVLWPLAKKFQNWIVDRSTSCNFTVFTYMHNNTCFYLYA